MIRRKGMGLLLALGLLAGSGYATYLWAMPGEAAPAFERDQFIELQIVRAPVRLEQAQFEMTQGGFGIVGYRDYPEEKENILSSRILRVFNAGRAQEFQGTTDGIEMVGSWGGSRPRADGRAGFVLDDFQFRFPNTSWETWPSGERHMHWSFAPGKTRLGREFSIVTVIASVLVDDTETFVRARWLAEPPEETVVKLHSGADDEDGAE